MRVNLLLLLFFVGSLFAQTNFGNYCYERCFNLTGDVRCNQLCYLEKNDFEISCNDLCISSGQSQQICNTGCKIMSEKRSLLSECFNNCTQSAPSDICDTRCNLTSTVKTIAKIVNLAIKENISDLNEIIELLNESLLANVSIENIEDFSLSSNASAYSIDGKSLEINRSVKIKIGIVNNIEEIELPVILEEGKKLKEFKDKGIILKDNVLNISLPGIENTVNVLQIKTDDFIGTGSSAKAKIKEIHLMISNISTNIDDSSGSYEKLDQKQFELNMDAKLTRLPRNVSLSITKTNRSEKDVRDMINAFNSTFASNNSFIRNVSIVFKVDKINLRNVKDVENVRLTFRIDKKWVNSNGGKSNIKILRRDGVIDEVLDTSFVREIGTNYEFEAFSRNGLSLYAVVTVGAAIPTEKYEPSGPSTSLPTTQTAGINIVMIGAVLIIVLVIVYFMIFNK